MIVKCTTNSYNALTDYQNSRATPQNHEHMLDASPGRHYIVYGIMRRKGSMYYFVHTDTEYTLSYWWMAAQLYEIVDDIKPSGWKYWKPSRFSWDYYETFDCYYDYKIANGIEDGELPAVQAFNAQVLADTTMPTDAELWALNLPFEKAKAKAAYEVALQLSRERGYERPELPEILQTNNHELTSTS